MATLSARQPIIIRAPDSILNVMGQVSLASIARAGAEVAQARSESAASLAESFAGPSYASIEDGLAATTDGQAFNVNNGDGTFTTYDNIGGEAENGRTLATTAALGAEAGAAIVGTPDADLQTNLNARVAHAESRAAMKALNTDRFKACQLREGGRSGMFELKEGTPPSDPEEGIYIVSNTSGFYWERVWDGVVGKPEWCGAIPNSNVGDIPSDNLTAINACIGLFPETRFAAADYWVDGTILHQVAYRGLRGCHGDGYNTGHGTRILSVEPTEPVIIHGPDEKPESDLTAFMRGVWAEDITFCHVPSTVPPSGGFGHTAVPTIKRQWLMAPRFKRIRAWEPLIGFYSTGLVFAKSEDCKVLRTEAKTGGYDFCWAEYLVGSAPFSGIPGNPSTYESGVSLEANPDLDIEKVALVCGGDFSDIFIDNLECSNVTHGVQFNGSGSKAQRNVHLRNAVIDQCSRTAVVIQGLVSGAVITISGGYFQCKASALAVIHARGSNGRVVITGGAQILGNEAPEGDGTIGVYGQDQAELVIDDSVVISECPRPIAVTGASSGKILASIENHNIGAATQSAISIETTGRWNIAPTISGRTNAFARAIHLIGTANDNISVDPTCIDPDAVSGAANKVVVNAFVSAVQLTSPGYYDPDGTSGTDGAGIHVTGITA